MKDIRPELTQYHLDFAQSTRELFIGRKIIGVEYIETDLSFLEKAIKPRYNTHIEGVESLDCGIRFKTDGGAIDVTWDGTFYHYGIRAFPNSQNPWSDAESIAWDVTKEQIWRDVVAERVVGLLIFWEVVISEGIDTPRSASYTYPQCLILQMSNGKEVFVSASEFLDKGNTTAMCFMDNLLVTTNRALAEQVKMFVPDVSE